MINIKRSVTRKTISSVMAIIMIVTSLLVASPISAQTVNAAYI